MPRTREIKQKFKSAIRRGTGEAYLLLRSYPKVNFLKEISQACLKNYAYDGQCESSRASYLYELAVLSGNAEQIKPAILNSLALEKEDTWSLVQLFELAKLYTQGGHADAKEAIYKRFMKYPFSSADWAGYPEIIDLDGFDGLKFIASKMGEALQNNPDDWQDDGIIRYFQKENPDIDAWRGLEEAGRENLFIKTYLDNVRKTGGSRDKPILEKANYANVVEEVLLTKSRIKLAYRNWTKKDLTLIAKQLIIEKNKQNQAKLLSIFRNNKFPLNSSFILDITKSKTTPDISHSAFNALALLKDTNVRNFAINGILNTTSPQKFTIIFKANYKTGDHEKLAKVVFDTKNEALIELLMVSLIEVYRFNKLKECAIPLEALYNKSNCALHRYHLIKLLIVNGVLSSKIKNELEFDCNNDIRQLAEGKVVQVIS